MWTPPFRGGRGLRRWVAPVRLGCGTVCWIALCSCRMTFLPLTTTTAELTDADGRQASSSHLLPISLLPNSHSLFGRWKVVEVRTLRAALPLAPFTTAFLACLALASTSAGCGLWWCMGRLVSSWGFVVERSEPTKRCRELLTNDRETESRRKSKESGLMRTTEGWCGQQ